MVQFKGKPVKVVEKMSAETVGETSETVSEKTSVRILKLVKTNPVLAIQELASIIGVSNRSIERNIQKLQKGNLLKRIGADFGGHWKVVE